MKTLVFCLVSVLITLNTTAQNTIEKPNTSMTNVERLSFHGLSFPEGVNGEIFKSFKINYQITERNQVQLQHFYEKYGTNESTNSSFLFKRYFKKNLYLFAGPEAVLGIDQENGLFGFKQVNMFGGVGYDVNPSLLLELGYRTRTYNNTNTNFGNPTPNSVILRASF